MLGWCTGGPSFSPENTERKTVKRPSKRWWGRGEQERGRRIELLATHREGEEAQVTE